MSRSLSVVLTSVALLLALCSPARARVSGGGPKATDCYAVLDGITATKGNRVECVDGDPTCDHDATCDGTCEFRIRVCVNQCEKPTTVQKLIKVKGAQLEIPPLPADGPACGGYVLVTTPKPKGRKPKPGKVAVSLTAIASAKPHADHDKVTLVCKPRKGACPVPLETREDPRIDPPPLLVDPPSPAGGSEVTVTLAAAADAATSLGITGQGCGELAPVPSAVGPLTLHGRVGGFGECDLVGTVTPPGTGPQRLSAHFRVTPTSLALPAAVVPDAEFRPGTLPPQSGTPDDPVIASIAAPDTLINGGSAQLRITLANPALAAAVQSVLVQLAGVGGDSGYFEAPAQLDGATVVVGLQLADTFVPAASSFTAGAVPQASPGGVDATVQLVDANGRAGNPVTRSFGTQAVQPGAVQVSLSWNSDTDLDLHVVEPDQTEIYYGNRTSSSGGTLNLDSNAGCSIDHIDNENITWPTGAPSGKYHVRVDFWSDCADPPDTPGKSAHWTVTVKACGQVATYEGDFAAGSSDRGGGGSGVEVGDGFDADCSKRVRGKATYEDFAPGRHGLATTATLLPIRFARVEVIRASDNEMLEAGETKQDGTFDISFKNTGQKGYYVEVQTQSYEKGATVNQVVKDDTGKIYAPFSPGIDETAEPDKQDLEIVARGKDGAAFNIYDQGVEGALFLRERYGRRPASLTWEWTQGKKGSCGGSTTCFDSVNGVRTISVYGVPGGADEYNDAVLLHEYGHFWYDTKVLHEADPPGGSHSSSNRVAPPLAWSEGAATFFSCRVRGSSLYLSVDAGEVTLVYSIELNLGIPLGTSDGTMNGNLSEALAAGILWDLVDPPTADEPFDTVSDTAGVFDALNYFASDKYTDRGPPGADLVDFLDGWFCRAHGQRGDASSGVQGITANHQFNYDFVALPDCR